MAKQIVPQSRFMGLSYGEKEGAKSTFLWAEGMDYRTDPTKLRILPSTVKSSGSIVEGLVLDYAREGTDSYFYDDVGNITKKTSANVWSKLHTVPNSQGNGMDYFGEDLFIYYAGNTVIGRYGPFGTGTGAKTFVDDFLGAEGGVPLNTHSLVLNGSSQYATAADSASLSVTGDLSLEIYTKITALPDVNASQVFMGKWNTNGNQRSYRFELFGVSGYFGDGSDGAVTISSNATEAPIDSACTGTSGAYTLSATNASFAAGQKILIHQTQGTGAGKWERNEIASYTAGTITLITTLANSYTTGAQVRVLLEYSSLTVNAGITWTVKAWDGTVGGILAFLCSGTVTINGTISGKGTDAPSYNAAIPVTGGGFRGARGNEESGSAVSGYAGEGTVGTQVKQNSANGNGGGGGYRVTNSAGEKSAGGGGGTNTQTGATVGTAEVNTTGGQIGLAVGAADLTTFSLGGGGGGRLDQGGSGDAYGPGASGGAAVFIATVTFTMGAAGLITCNGGAGHLDGGGGGGGGSVMLKVQTATLGTAQITASGGAAGASSTFNGGAGGAGRVHIDYYTSFTGTSSPTLTSAQDDGLNINTTYQLRLGISSNGTNEEFLTYNLTAPPTLSQWDRYQVTWDASASIAYFYRNGTLLGQSTGTLTAIYDSTALFTIGCSLGAASAAEKFFGGSVDDIRVWDDIRTQNELFINNDIEISGSSINLKAYWQVDNSTADATAGGNTLTLQGSAVYSALDVPFASPTARRDLDQSLDTSGQTYTLTTAINEGSTHRQTFIPAKDPQKSIEVNIAAVGSGNWTLVVHDGLNREVATITVAVAQLRTGDYEFIFTDEWRPVIGASYHFHLYSSVADGTVVTTTLNDLETVDFHTYFQFLVSDKHHPIRKQLNLECIGNERYVATWDGITYNPHRLTLPSGYRIRCSGTWREYIVFGATQGSSLSAYDQGKLFFWDGIKDTYNFYRDVLQGGINSIQSGDPMYFIAGYSGDLMKFEGGQPIKVRRLPYVALTDTLEVNRNAMSMYRGLTHIGLGNSTSTTIKKGVFSYGTLTAELPESLSFDYKLSHGLTTGAAVEVGLITPVDGSLLISWKNGNFYGVDQVSPTNSPFTSATIEFLISDMDKIWAEKQVQTVRGYFKALASGDSYTLKYKIDRESYFVPGDAVSTVGAKEVRLSMPTMGNRFNEFQLGVDVTTASATSPEFYGFGYEVDDMNHERRT